jgi:hypothetical protein
MRDEEIEALVRSLRRIAKLSPKAHFETHPCWQGADLIESLRAKLKAAQIARSPEENK